MKQTSAHAMPMAASTSMIRQWRVSTPGRASIAEAVIAPVT